MPHETFDPNKLCDDILKVCGGWPTDTVADALVIALANFLVTQSDADKVIGNTARVASTLVSMVTANAKFGSTRFSFSPDGIVECMSEEGEMH